MLHGKCAVVMCGKFAGRPACLQQTVWYIHTTTTLLRTRQDKQKLKTQKRIAVVWRHNLKKNRRKKTFKIAMFWLFYLGAILCNDCKI